MGIRTPDLLHAIQRQPVHSRPSPQVAVQESAPRSACVRACCGTFLLYEPLPLPHELSARTPTTRTAYAAPSRAWPNAVRSPAVTPDFIHLHEKSASLEGARWSPVGERAASVRRGPRQRRHPGRALQRPDAPYERDHRTLVGGCRRELLDRALVWNQAHLRRLLRE
jgi:hypothetical protein